MHVGDVPGTFVWAPLQYAGTACEGNFKRDGHPPMQPYLDFMRHVRDHGHRKDDRTGTGTLSVFGYQMRFDLGQAFRC